MAVIVSVQSKRKLTRMLVILKTHFSVISTLFMHSLRNFRRRAYIIVFMFSLLPSVILNTTGLGNGHVS